MPQRRTSKNKRVKRIPLATRKRQQMYGNIGLFVGFLFLSVALFAQIMHLKSLSVLQTHIVGVSEREKIEQTRYEVDKVLSDSKFHIIPPNNRLFLSADKLSSAILSLPWVEKVEAKISYKKPILTVKVIPKKPVAQLCLSDKADKCVMIDKNGTLFDYALKSYDLPIYKLESVNSIYLGSKIDNFANLQKFVDEMNVKSDHVLLRDKGDALVYTPKFYIKILPNKNAQAQLAKLNSSLLELDEDNLEYLDLRFKNRIYYKEKESEPQKQENEN